MHNNNTFVRILLRQAHHRNVITTLSASDRQCRVSDVKVGFALSKVITAGIWGISFNQKPITFFKKENREEKTNKRDIILILLQTGSTFVSRTC